MEMLSKAESHYFDFRYINSKTCIHSLVNSVIHSFIHSVIYTFIHFSPHSYIHSLSQPAFSPSYIQCIHHFSTSHFFTVDSLSHASPPPSLLSSLLPLPPSSSLQLTPFLKLSLNPTTTSGAQYISLPKYLLLWRPRADIRRKTLRERETERERERERERKLEEHSMQCIKPLLNFNHPLQSG